MATTSVKRGVVSDPLAYFEERAAGYRCAAERGLWAWQRQREAAAVCALAGELRGLAVLELGCGAGFYARRFAGCGAGPVVAVDAVPAMLARIDDPRVTTLAGDVATIDAGRRFDVVVAAGVLEFVLDPVAVLANARRHLLPGGRLVVLVPPDTLAGRLYGWFHRGHGLTIKLFSPQAFGTMAAAAGMRLLDRRHVFPYGDVHLLVASPGGETS